MEKLKLTITNNGCNPIKVFGRRASISPHRER